jgi:hypothetical protein
MILGLVPIAIYFRRKIYWANRTIEIGTIPNSAFPKLPMVRKAEQEKFNYQVISVLTFISYFASFLNFNFGIVGGWIILSVIGISISISFYLLTTPSINYEEEADDKVSKLQRLLLAEEAKKISILILAATIGLSGYWANQVTKNISAEREMAVGDVSRLAETGWCSNFEDIDVYDGGQEVVKTGGWPCIYIGSIWGLSFSKENKQDKMCGWVNLHRDTGAPGEERVQLSYKSFEVCSSRDEWGGRWSEKTFSDKIYGEIKPDLDTLQQALCRNYGYRMGAINYATYC